MSAFANFAKGSVVQSYGATDQTILLEEDASARFPSPPFNAVWWNSSRYPNSADDPNVEIITVTGITGDYLSVIRGAEATAATAKNTAGATYSIAQTITARTLDQLLTRAVSSEFAIANSKAYFRHRTTTKYHQVFLDTSTGARVITVDDTPLDSVLVTQIDTGSLYGNACALNGQLYLKAQSTLLYHYLFLETVGAARVIQTTDQAFSNISSTSFPNGTFSDPFSVVNGRAYLKHITSNRWHEIYLDSLDGANILFSSDATYI